MEISDLAYKLILLLSPGIVTALLFRYLTIHKSFTAFYFFVAASFFGITNYLLVEFLAQVFYLIPQKIFFKNNSELQPFLKIWQTFFENEIQPNKIELLYVFLISIPVGFISVFLHQRKILIRFANNFLKITNRTGDDDVWSFFLNSQETHWVWVRDFRQKLTYFGMIRDFLILVKKEKYSCQMYRFLI